MESLLCRCYSLSYQFKELSLGVGSLYLLLIHYLTLRYITYHYI